MSDANFMVVKATKIKGRTPSGAGVEITPKQGRAVVCIVGDAVDLGERLTKDDVLSRLGVVVAGMTEAAPAAPQLTSPIAIWQQDGDAREWARAFLQHQAQSADPAGFVEEGNLIGWFANAMMCAVDREAQRLFGADALGRDNGLTLIAAERRRQVEAEGFTTAHDDLNEMGEMAIAAACFATHHTGAMVVNPHGDKTGWPWDEKWDKRGKQTTVQLLVKAGALIAAEIDRQQRRLIAEGDGNG